MVAQVATGRQGRAVPGQLAKSAKPYPYGIVQPIWRRDPLFTPTPFAQWLEVRCAERRLTVAALASRMLAAGYPAGNPRGAIYSWLRSGYHPQAHGVAVLARALDVSEADVLAAMQAIPVLPPPPPRARAVQAKAPPAYDPMQSPAAVHAQMWERFIAGLLEQGQWTPDEARAFADRVRQAADAHERGLQ